MSWFDEKKEGILLYLLIQPKASCTAIVGFYGESSERPRLKIRINAPPVDGAANEELITFLSKKLRVARSNFQIIRGRSSKMKDILCIGVGKKQIEQGLFKLDGIKNN